MAKKFDLERVKASIKEYEKENSKISWNDDAGILDLFAHFNSAELLPVAFDTVSGVTQQGGQDSTMASTYSEKLGASIVVSWEVATGFESRPDFLKFLERLCAESVELLAKIDAAIK